jgi:hypothetical protein
MPFSNASDKAFNICDETSILNYFVAFNQKIRQVLRKDNPREF